MKTPRYATHDSAGAGVTVTPAESVMIAGSDDLFFASIQTKRCSAFPLCSKCEEGVRNKEENGRGDGGGEAGGEDRTLEGGGWRVASGGCVSSAGHCETGLSVASL